MDFYDFNLGSTAPILHLSNANGFPPKTYHQALEPLFEHFHVLSFLPRPWWGTSPPEWLRSWDQMADDLLNKLKGMEAKKVVGIGHSLGGVLTLCAAVRQPELFEKVILIDPTMLSPRFLWRVRLMKLIGKDARSFLIEGALRRKRTWESRKAAYQYFRDRKLFKEWSDEMVLAYTEGMTAPSPTGGVYLTYSPEWEAQIYRTIPTDVWKMAKMLKVPTLVIRGENSNTFTADSEKAFRKVRPEARFEVIAGAGHLVAQERPMEIGKSIADWLRPPNARETKLTKTL